jgi:hypothetical protein
MPLYNPEINCYDCSCYDCSCYDCSVSCYDCSCYCCYDCSSCCYVDCTCCYTCNDYTTYCCFDCSCYSATPGGSGGSVQYNSSSCFGGDSYFTYDCSTYCLAVGSGYNGTINTSQYVSCGCCGLNANCSGFSSICVMGGLVVALS